MLAGNYLFNDDRAQDMADLDVWENIMRYITGQDHYYAINPIEFFIEDNFMYFQNIEEPLVTIRLDFTTRESALSRRREDWKDIMGKCMRSQHVWIPIKEFNMLLEGVIIRGIMKNSQSIEDTFRLLYKIHDERPYDN